LSCADGRFVDAAATCTLNSLFAHAQRRAAVQAHNRPSCARSHGFTSIVAGRGRCSRLDSLPSCLCCRAPGVRAGAATSRLRHHALDTHRRATGWTDGVGAGGRTAISGGSVAAAETRGRRPARRCRAGAQVGTDCMRALPLIRCPVRSARSSQCLLFACSLPLLQLEAQVRQLKPRARSRRAKRSAKKNVVSRSVI
jgi:hypothetical protein